MRRSLLPIILAPYSGRAAALFSAAASPQTSARRKLIDQTLRQLDNAALIQKLDVLYMLAGAAPEIAHRNWCNPGGQTVVPANGPTFAADRGYTPTAANSYLDTNYNPGVGTWKFVQNDASAGCWCRTNDAQAGSSPFAAFAATNSKMTSLNPRNGSDQVVFSINGDANTTAANTNGSGLFTVRRTASTAIACFRNAVSLGTDVTVSSALPSLNHFICAINNNGGGISNKATTREIALYFAGASLSDAQISSLYTILLSYLTAVGAA